MTKTTKVVIGILGLLVVVYYLKNKKNAPKTSGNILDKWKGNFDSKNLSEIVNTYAPDGILVSTFGDILQGRKKIEPYFKGLFEKENLKVTYMGEPIVTKVDGSTMYTGIYEFSFTENGKLNKTKARYSIIEKDGFITKQHSSEVPN
jgi:hypothetical protein